MTPTSIRAFIERAREHNAILEENGATEAAKARGRLLQQLEELLAAEAEQTVSVEEAAELTGVHPETVRRAVRSGEIPDLRTVPGGTIRVRVADLDYLRGKARGEQQRATLDVSSAAVAALASL